MTYINKFYEINNNILENYDVKKRNFQVLKNLNEIDNNNEIIQIIKKINNNNNIKDKISTILDLYDDMNLYKINNEMNQDKINNEMNIDKINDDMNQYKINDDMNQCINKMTIIYNINNQNKIKIFDGNFVENNKNICYFRINNITQDLCNYIEIKNKEEKNLEINYLKLIQLLI